MIDFMAEDGIVGQYAGSQAREVLMTMAEWAAAQGEEPLPPDPPPRRLKINPHAAEQVAEPAEDPDLTAHDDEVVDDLEYEEEEEETTEEEHENDSTEEGEEDALEEEVEGEEDLEDNEEYEYVYEDEEEDEDAE
jgi:S-DNA-T family DNA segregation ATPase FtsK/SpoIIIE